MFSSIGCKYLNRLSFRWATHSVSINEGLDQEMPTGSWFDEKLTEMVTNGTVTMEKIDDSVSRILVPM